MDWHKATKLLGAAKDVVIVTHINPDGDAIGSMLGLAWALRGMNKNVVVAVDDGVPAPLRFLPGADEVQTHLPPLMPDGIGPGLVVAVDCGDESRMGQVGVAATANGAPLINLDHHITNTRFGLVNLVDTDTVASAEGVYDWLRHLGLTPDSRIATCLLTGIVTDTLCFRTSNVTADVLEKVQALMHAGAPLNEITQRTVGRKSYADLLLWSRVMPAVRLEDGVIWVVIDRATRQAVPSAYMPLAENGDGGLVGVLISVDEADMAAVFRELDDGRVEMGLRAVPGYDVSGVALSFGGGGHPLAAGATVPGPLQDVVQEALKRLFQAAQETRAVAV